MENRFVTTLDERLKKFTKKRSRGDDGNSDTEEDSETSAYTSENIKPPDHNGKVNDWKQKIYLFLSMKGLMY